MDDATLDAFVRQYISANPGPEVEFTWQGGEPTLAGIAFYERALRLQRKYADGKRITNSIQTNGVLINEAWASFWPQTIFWWDSRLMVPPGYTDRYRKTRSQGSVFDKVVRAMSLLQQHNVDVNVLTVVNNVTAEHPQEIYQFSHSRVGGKICSIYPCR